MTCHRPLYKPLQTTGASDQGKQAATGLGAHCLVNLGQQAVADEPLYVLGYCHRNLNHAGAHPQ